MLSEINQHPMFHDTRLIFSVKENEVYLWSLVVSNSLLKIVFFFMKRFDVDNSVFSLMV